MNEKQQNLTLDEWIDKCPMFNYYTDKFHNVEIKTSPSRTLCEIDDLYVFSDYILLGENKSRNTRSCHKKMETQMKRFKRYENCIKRHLGLDTSLPVHYFYAHFDNDELHVKYEGTKK